MSRDIGVTVTRESRVSHATTTTPHHTMYVLTSPCGCSDLLPNPKLRSRRGLGFGANR